MKKANALCDPQELPTQLKLPSRLHLQNGPCETHGFDPEYLLEGDTRYALRLAWARKRPLLVLGEAGLGKSQLAAALANEWGVPLLAHTVQSTTTAQDLFWQYDAVQRLAEAQFLGALHKEQPLTEAAARKALDPLKYVKPGVLWWAWGWDGLKKQSPAFGGQETSYWVEPDSPDGWKPENGCVLLIDEIDKAPADLPNNLLDVLESGGFDIPWNGRRVALPDGQSPPLIIITSNGERDLPAAFRRRCFQVRLDFGGGHPNPEDQRGWLRNRAAAHFGNEERDSILTKTVAEQIFSLREKVPEGEYRPGVSEFLDLLYSVKKLEPDVSKQIDLVKQLAPFVGKESVAN